MMGLWSVLFNFIAYHLLTFFKPGLKILESNSPYFDNINIFLWDFMNNNFIIFFSILNVFILMVVYILGYWITKKGSSMER